MSAAVRADIDDSGWGDLDDGNIASTTDSHQVIQHAQRDEYSKVPNRACPNSKHAIKIKRTA